MENILETLTKVAWVIIWTAIVYFVIHFLNAGSEFFEVATEYLKRH